jgi:HEAT repeat protein
MHTLVLGFVACSSFLCLFVPTGVWSKTMPDCAMNACDVDELIRLLMDKDVEERREAAFCLACRGPLAETEKAVPALIQALNDHDAQVRASCVFALARIGKAAKPASRKVAQLLTDKQLAVRQMSALFFQAVGPENPEMQKALLEATKDKDTRVRFRAAVGLTKVDPIPARALTVLYEAMSIEKDDDEEAEKREAPLPAEISLTLGEVGLPVVALLKKGLKDKNTQVRQCSLGALAKMARTLEKGRYPADVIQLLIDILNDENPTVVYGTIYVLSQIRMQASHAVPSIVKCLRHKEWSVRYRAAIDLRSFGASAREAIPLLKEALKDQDERVRIEAKFTLELWSR